MGRGLVIIFLVIRVTLPAHSQNRYVAGTLPQVNVNFSLSPTVKLNTKLESRQVFAEREPDEPTRNRFRYDRTDVGLVLTKKMAVSSTLGGGYLIRFEDHQFVHRFIQQASFVNKLDLITVAHRFVVDETFRQTEPPEVRLRYRLGLEKALNGQQIDPGEMYVKFNNEYLGIWSPNTADLEIRGSLALGYNVIDTSKIELGIEYRVNEFNQPSKAHQYWTTLSWFFSI